jgi:hypothetical protein
MNAEKFLYRKLAGTRLPGNYYRFIIEALDEYANEQLIQQRKRHEKEIDRLNEQAKRLRGRFTPKDFK